MRGVLIWLRGAGDARGGWLDQRGCGAGGGEGAYTVERGAGQCARRRWGAVARCGRGVAGLGNDGRPREVYVHHVVDTAIQLHGALGYSQDTPLAAWYTHIRSQRLVDGPDEVHRWTVGRNVIKAYESTGTTASACGGDLL